MLQNSFFESVHASRRKFVQLLYDAKWRILWLIFAVRAEELKYNISWAVYRVRIIRGLADFYCVQNPRSTLDFFP